MLQLLLATAAAICIVFGWAPIHAHDWYPLECCGRNDCMPARGSAGDGRGGMTVIVEDMRISIPEGIAPRPSLDGRIHVCIRTFANEVDGNIVVIPICLFLPAQV